MLLLRLAVVALLGVQVHDYHGADQLKEPKKPQR